MRVKGLLVAFVVSQVRAFLAVGRIGDNTWTVNEELHRFAVSFVRKVQSFSLSDLLSDSFIEFSDNYFINVSILVLSDVDTSNAFLQSFHFELTPSNFAYLLANSEAFVIRPKNIQLPQSLHILLDGDQLILDLLSLFEFEVALFSKFHLVSVTCNKSHIHHQRPILAA